MPGTALLDLPPEIFCAILKEAVLGQCFDPISATEDVETSSDWEALSDDSVESHIQSGSENPKASTPDIRVVLQWRKVNHTFDDEVMLCIEDVELLRPHNWHDVDICPACHCQAPIDSLSSFAASFLVRQPNSRKPWKSNVPALLSTIVDDIICQESQQPEGNLQQQRHHYLKVLYQEFVQHMVQKNYNPKSLTGHGHELLPGIHPNDSLTVPNSRWPEIGVISARIFLGQLSPVLSFIRHNKDRGYVKYPSIHGGCFESFIYAAVKTGQHDLTRELLDLGARFPSIEIALEIALQREDLLMIQLLLKSSPKSDLERCSFDDLLLRSTQLDLRPITNVLLDYGQDIRHGLACSVLRNACYNGNEDLVRQMLTSHPGMDLNRPRKSLTWCLESSISPVGAAARRGHEGILRLLLEAGATTHSPFHFDDDDEDIEKEYMMKAAAAGGHIGIARILLDAGANLSPGQWAYVVQSYAEAREPGAQNGRFIHFLLDEKLVDISKYMREYSIYLYDMVYNLCIAGDVEAIRLFASYGMPMHGDFYERMHRRTNPMQIATVYGQQELIQTLEELGAPPCGGRQRIQRRTPHKPPNPRDVSLSCSKWTCEAHRLELERRA
ncbi:hypothetical protein PG997_014209 [Apiospora hydei]|uniref:Ankyrin n=1 Tax=Apiospora hydei TaxID=1337664 RepID=A0ABR1UT92_9PEZI